MDFESTTLLDLRLLNAYQFVNVINLTSDNEMV